MAGNQKKQKKQTIKKRKSVKGNESGKAIAVRGQSANSRNINSAIRDSELEKKGELNDEEEEGPVTGVQDNDETEALIDEDEEESAAGVLENDEKMD
jgi:hypothetical protein